MVQRLFCALACSALLIPSIGWPQQQPQPLPGRIIGTVRGEAGPLASAGVTVRSTADSAIVAGVMTAGDGRFRVEGVAFGNYLLRISYVGYKPHNILNIVISKDTSVVDLGVITLAIAPVALAGVEAQAERAPVVVASDRTIYETKTMPVASTGKAVDVLRNVPELEVDMNGKVTIRGNQAVAIHFDGRPAPLRGDALTNFLQQMPGSRIARVEVIPNPSAKYDPEGMGGIVNIVMKEGMDLGLSGSLSLSASTRLQRGLNARLNYQRGRYTFFAGGGLTWSDNRYSMHDRRENLLAQPITYYETIGDSKNDGTFNMFDFTSELKVGKQAHFWLSGNGYGSNRDNDGAFTYGITDSSGSALDRYDRDNVNSYAYTTADFSTGFKQVFQQMRHEFTIDLRHRHNGNDGDGRSVKQPLLVTSSGELTLNDNTGDDDELSLQADYTRPLGAKGKLDAGVRVALGDQDSETNYRYFATPTEELLRQSSNSSWLHEEDLASAYLTLNRTLGKLNMQGGVRGERATTTFHVRTTGNSYDNNYTSLFPSANVAYDFGGGRTARASYSKRVTRPYPYLLNPYNPSADTLNRYSGNPDLKPSYTHSFSLDYNSVGKEINLRAGPFYRRTVNNWDAIRLVNSAGVSTITYRNIASMESYGLSVTSSLRPTPTAKLGGSLTLTSYREIRDASNLDAVYSTDAWRWTVSSNSMYRFDKTLSASLGASYSPPRQMMQGRVSGMTMTNIGLRKQFMGTKATWSLTVFDPFDLYHYSFTTNDRTHVQRSRTSYRMRQAYTALTYNFGKPPQQNSRKQQTEQQGQETVQIR